MAWGKRKDAPVTRDPFEKGTPLSRDSFDQGPSVTRSTFESIAEVMGEDSPVVDESGPSVPTIGPSLQIKGELTGHEDVYIDGHVEGSIDVQGHTLTIGPNANIRASLHARCVIIKGEVVGNVNADEKAEITASGSLLGDIRAQRVVLAEESRFKGSIDMGWSESKQPETKRTETRRETKRAEAKHVEAKHAQAQPEAPAPQQGPQDPFAEGTASNKGPGLNALNWDN